MGRLCLKTRTNLSQASSIPPCPSVAVVAARPPSESSDGTPATSSALENQSNDAMAIVFPSSEPDATPESSVGRSSWFGSLGRARGKENAAKITQLQGAGTPKSTADASAFTTSLVDATVSFFSPEVTVVPPTPPQPQSAPKPSETPPSIPRAIPSSPKHKRSWFAASSPTPSRPGASPTSPSPLNSSTSIASSLDEEVPELSNLAVPPAISPPLVHGPAGGDESTVRGRLNSLNPSTSRFTISLPLLGRSKIPWDQVVARAEDTHPGTLSFTRLILRHDESF